MLQRLLEVGLGLRPALGALVGDAAEVEDAPVGFAGSAIVAMPLRVGLGGIGEPLVRAVDVAERDHGLDIGRVGVDHALDVDGRLVGAVEPSRQMPIWMSALRRSGERSGMRS